VITAADSLKGSQKRDSDQGLVNTERLRFINRLTTRGWTDSLVLHDDQDAYCGIIKRRSSNGACEDPNFARWSPLVVFWLKKIDSMSLQHIDGVKNSVSRLFIHFRKPDYD